MNGLDLPLIAVVVIAAAVLLYVLLDGFDLGVGILFPLARSPADRDVMMAAIAPYWDGNETWLVLGGGGLFALFPGAYAILMPAFYLPVMGMLLALILRGVAFEFRLHGRRRGKRLWTIAFAAGSTGAAFAQGLVLGGFVQGVKSADGAFAGGPVDWATPYSLLTAVGLVAGYALLGAAWLVGKTENDLRDRSYRQLPRLVLGVSAFLAVGLAYALVEHLQIMHRWLERPYLLVFPVLGAGAACGLGLGIRRRIDRLPFAMTALIFLAAFGTLAVSFWPYMIPFSVTVSQAASPAASLDFMFWGAGLVVAPLILLSTATVYRAFKGKTAEPGDDD